MKPVTYRHSWSAGQTEEQEMESLYGSIIASEDTSPDWEVERSVLLQKDDEFTWLSAHGCSCWDGDYDGWTLSLNDLKTLARKTWDNRYDWRDTADALVAKWIMENL